MTAKIRQFADFPVGDLGFDQITNDVNTPELVTVTFDGKVVHTGLIGTWKDSFPAGATSTVTGDDSSDERRKKFVARFTAGNATTEVKKEIV